MKKNKKYGNGGSLFLTKPYGGSVANSSVTPGQLPDYQMGSNVNSGVIQNNLRDIQHFYGNNFPYMAEGGDMEDESGATDSFYTNKLNGFIDRVRGTAQKNLENNLLKEAMREMRGGDETVDYGPQDMEMAQYGLNMQDQSQNTYDPSYINNFANAYGKTKRFTDSLQDFAKMNRIIQPTTEYQKVKRKFDLGFTDRFKEDNPWVDSSGNPVNYTKASFEDGGTLIPMFQGDEDASTVDFWTPEEMQYLQSLPKKERDAILKKGDAAAKQQVQGVVKSKQPTAPVQPQAQPQTAPNKSSATGTQSVTANNTSVNTTSGTTPTTTGTTTTTTNPPAATNTNPAANAFEGYTFHTDANGNKYIVTPEGQMYSPYSGAAGSDNVYTPQEYYTPYNTPAGQQTYSFLERNKLTPEFREAMRSGALNNPQPQLLGLPHIEYRKALFPKNRNKEVKSISWQYGKLYGDPFGEDMSMEPEPATSNTTSSATPVTNTTPGITTPKIDSPAIDAANAWNYRPGQGGFAPSGGWQDFPGNLENQQPRVGPLNTDQQETGFQSGYVPGSADYPNVPILKKQGGSLDKFIKQYQGGGGVDWDALAEQFNQDMDSELADIGPIDPNTRQPLKKPDVTMTDMDRINTVDSGTEYDTKNQPNTWFVENPFNVEEKFKNRKKRDPWKAIRNINLATGFFNLDEAAGLENQLKKATHASEAFADVDNSWGQYHPLTGQYMGPKGKQPPVMNTGFAQYGGSLYDNLKQGDEMYLTQEQIDQLLKRGVKLSYLD